MLPCKHHNDFLSANAMEEQDFKHVHVNRYMCLETEEKFESV